MPEVKVIATPESHFADFLDFMSERSDWVWPLMEWCAHEGVMHASTNCFLLARPVNSAIPVEDLVEMADLDKDRYPDRELTQRHDTWHIVYASGGIEHFFPLAPYPLRRLMWHRDGEKGARFYNYETIKRRIHGKQT